MTVKTIFKTLIGTVAIMVISSLIIEVLNICVTSIQLTQISRIACKQSAVLFSQETYKERTDGSTTGGSVNMNSVLNTDGGEYISGNFYGRNLTAQEIYENIYTSDEFKEWLESDAVDKGNWKSVDLIDMALNKPGELVTSLPNNINASNYDSEVMKYTDSMLALSYKNVLMTPLNMGVPYLDEEILERIFRWNLAQITSDCHSSLIRQDENGDYCVHYKGFRVYADEAQITNLEYKVYDIEDNGDLSDFKNLTHIDPNKLGYDDSKIAYLGGYENDDERRRICVVGIEFDIPIGYEGVTPIKSIFNYIWNTEVEGWNDTSRNTYYQWNDRTATLQSGGFGDRVLPTGVLPVPGKLIYYVVR